MENVSWIECYRGYISGFKVFCSSTPNMPNEFTTDWWSEEGEKRSKTTKKTTHNHQQLQNFFDCADKIVPTNASLVQYS